MLLGETISLKRNDATDFEVKQACTSYGTDLIMKDIKRDGRPHNAVGIRVSIGCRTGLGTAFPHPNQFHHNRIKKGDSIQIAGAVRIGGHGGELYRYYQIEPWDAHREKVWEVVTETSLMQARESKAGVTCGEVAEKCHSYQVSRGKGHPETSLPTDRPWIGYGRTPTSLHCAGKH